MSSRLRLATAAAAIGLAGLVGLVGLAGGPPTATLAAPDLSPPRLLEYVALGDSYAAAPGVPETSGVDGCFRSDHNYAHLLARAEGLRLVDVTCSGATTQDVVDRQVDSLRAGTDLVTIGIGGNDEDLFATLIRDCLDLAGDDPRGAPCTERGAFAVDELLPAIEDNVAHALDAVVDAAPRARVVVVGYPDLLPASGTCPDRIALAAGDHDLVRAVARELSDALRRQAERRDLAFVDVYEASHGHDICSDDPWVNGARVAPDGTIPFHPLAAEQEAVARMVADVLRRRS